MLIEKVLPEVIGGKASLQERIVAEAQSRVMAKELVEQIGNALPATLAKAPCFLDKMTDVWRYEFGIPFDIGKELIWGTHMWIPVNELISSCAAAHARLPEKQLKDYMHRLGDEKRHRDTLVEMIPADKVDAAIHLEFEVAGLGAGRRTVDWLIKGPGMRPVLLDVKNRSADFLRAMAADKDGLVPAAPDHDPALLFRSVPEKFSEADPDTQLQGAWICTHIKQSEAALAQAFDALDPRRIHFAILGDWKADAFVLARRSSDSDYLRGLFRLKPSNRFTATEPAPA